jgi:thymidylate synthase (FAD)
MPKVLEPHVILLAATELDAEGFGKFLRFLDVPDWKTDAASQSEALVEMAGKLCYMSFSTDLNKNLTRVGTRKNSEYIQQQIVEAKHGSVLEHATCTFALMNVSRVLTHELVRHRIGSYSQVSGRYVRTDEIGYVLPSVIAANSHATKIFHDAFEYMEGAIERLSNTFHIDDQTFAMKKVLTSAFRRIIGNGQCNHIIATYNHRTLRHLIELRTAPGAEEEIRLVFGAIFDIVSVQFPSIYADATCVTSITDPIRSITFKAQKV